MCKKIVLSMTELFSFRLAGVTVLHRGIFDREVLMRRKLVILLTKIYSTPDGPEKIPLLDQFVEDFGKEPDLALLADQLYVHKATLRMLRLNFAQGF